MSLRLQPVQVATGSDDSAGQLAFADNFLVAVLVRLSDDHENDAGKWFLEAAFGPVSTAAPPTFVDLNEAQTWIEQRLVRGLSTGLGSHRSDRLSRRSAEDRRFNPPGLALRECLHAGRSRR